MLRKLGSVKVWIALWSMGLITYIVVKDMAGFSSLATLMVGPIIGYLAANVWEDKIHLEKTMQKEGQGDGK
jgi:MFS-type transporter involved in bile tolerance (Atg22 family)